MTHFLDPLAYLARLFPDSLDHVLQAPAAALLASLWQGGLLAAGLFCALRLVPRTSAALRFSIWTIAFWALVSLPILVRFPVLLSALSFFWPHSAPVAASLAQPLAESSASPWLRVDARWSTVFVALWAMASLYRAIQLNAHSIRLTRLWRNAKPIDRQPSSLPDLWGRKPVELCTTQDLDRPGVIGFFSPRILIPEWLAPHLTQEEMDQIVLHESEHLRRGDDWTNLLQKMTLALFPLNPALMWIERRLCQEREMACDEGVVRKTGAPRTYAACLARLAERGLRHRAEALALGVWQRRPELAQRVHRILQRRTMLNPMAARGILAVSICALALGSFELSRCPQLIAFETPASAPVRFEASYSVSPNSISPAIETRRAVGEPGHAYRAVDTAFQLDTQQVRNQPNLLPAPRMTLLKATMPAEGFEPRASFGAPSLVHAGAHKTSPAAKQFASHAAKQTPSAAPAYGVELTEYRSSQGQQQIVVFTTWQIPATAPGAKEFGSGQVVRDFTAETSAKIASGSDPADSIPGEPASLDSQQIPTELLIPVQALVPTPNGWLVIQL